MNSLLRNRVIRKMPVIAIVFWITILGGWNASFHLYAQTITVRLLNAKSGKPMKGKKVTFEWDGKLNKTVITIDKSGLGTVVVPTGVREFTLLAGPKVGKEPYRIPYLNCNVNPWATIEVSLALDKGYLPRNDCSRISTAAHPGEVVFWALPNPWWQPDMQ